METKSEKAQRILAWCLENLGPVEYENPHLSGKILGGNGWELYLSPVQARAFIDDEALRMFFNLAFMKE
jgi:hypothetical protein